MVAGHGSNGRGGGQIGHGGSSTGRGGSSTPPPAGEKEKTEADKVRSDAALISGSYGYRNYGVTAPPAFAKRESDRYRRRASSPSAASSSSSSRQRPSTAFVVKMEVDDEPELPRLPQFAPGDFHDDAELERRLPQLGHAGFAPADFVEERNLDILVGLVSRSSQRDADKAAKWQRIAEEQGRVFVDLGSDTE